MSAKFTPYLIQLTCITLDGNTFNLVQESLIMKLYLSFGTREHWPASIRDNCLEYKSSRIDQPNVTPPILKVLVPPHLDALD